MPGQTENGSKESRFMNQELRVELSDATTERGLGLFNLGPLFHVSTMSSISFKFLPSQSLVVLRIASII